MPAVFADPAVISVRAVGRGPPGLEALAKLLLYTLTLYGMSGSVSVMCPVAHTRNSEVKSLPAQCLNTRQQVNAAQELFKYSRAYGSLFESR